MVKRRRARIIPLALTHRRSPMVANEAKKKRLTTTIQPVHSSSSDNDDEDYENDNNNIAVPTTSQAGGASGSNTPRARGSSRGNALSTLQAQFIDDLDQMSNRQLFDVVKYILQSRPGVRGDLLDVVRETLNTNFANL